MKESSRKLVTTSFLSLYSFIKYSITLFEGSIINGYRSNRLRMIAFSKHTSSLGSECSCHRSLSSAVQRYSIIDCCSLNLIPELRSCRRHLSSIICRHCCRTNPSKIEMRQPEEHHRLMYRSELRKPCSPRPTF